MKVKKKTKENLINWREFCVGLLDSERQNYENNPNFLTNVKMANSVLIQNEIRHLSNFSDRLSRKLRRNIRNSKKKISR